jgi:hypothetical protein
MDRVIYMGRTRDMTQRESLARVDTLNRRSRIAAARYHIYEKEYAVNSAAVEKLLGDDSLVPSMACIISRLRIHLTDGAYHLECVFK